MGLGLLARVSLFFPPCEFLGPVMFRKSECFYDTSWFARSGAISFRGECFCTGPELEPVVPELLPALVGALDSSP